MCRSRRPWVPLAVSGVLLLVIAACSSGSDTGGAGGPGGSDGTAAATTAPPTTEAPIVPATTDPEGTTRFNTYWLRDCPSPDVATEVGSCRIAVGESRITSDPDILTAAMEALNIGPNESEKAAGLTSNVRSIAEFYGVTVEGDIATVDYNRYFETATTRPQVAQVVYTLTQFPSITAVRFIVDHAPNGATGTRATSRADVLEVTPSVLVESPALGAVVSPTFGLGGILLTGDITFTARVAGVDGAPLAQGPGTIGAVAGAVAAPPPFQSRITVPPGTSGPVGLVVTANDGAESLIPIVIQGG